MDKATANAGLNLSPRLRPRWKKVLSDLWSNRVRTLLVVASVGIGLFAVGMIATIHAILVSDMRGGYAAQNPANIMVNGWNYDDDMVEYVGKVEGVQEAEGVRLFDLMVRTGPDEWGRMTVQAVPDFAEKNINHLKVEQGRGDPDDHEILIERNKLNQIYFAGASGVGGEVEVKLPSGKIRHLKMVGKVHDQTVGAASIGGGFFMAPIQGFITTDTLEWLEQPNSYNMLYVTVAEGREDEEHIRRMANRVSEAIEDENGLVFNAIVRGSREHPNADYVEAMTGVLYLLGALVVFLSAFLITNTLSALLKQQAQQIAIMKTVGGRTFQVAGIYMALITAFGLLALAAALPLSRQVAFTLLDLFAQQINFEVIEYRTIVQAVVLQVVIALVVPQVAGMVPVLRGARMKVQDALSGSLTESVPSHRGLLNPRNLRLGRRRISRPLLISLRNTFRNKGRLALTLITLTLGGAIFIATFNVRASMETYINRMGRYFMADVNLTMDGPYRISTIQEELRRVPGVAMVEGWAYGRCELLVENANGELEAGDAVQLLAPPADSPLIDPILLEGRWVIPEDSNAIVLSERFMSRYPDLKVGDTLRMRVNGEDTDWVVVGFFQLAGKSAGYVAYTGYEYLSEKVHQPNRAYSFRITADRPGMTLAEQRELGAMLEDYLQSRGYGVIDVQTGHTLIDNAGGGLNTLTSFLLIMAVLTAIVGSIGLMGTMSMNVLDRTREIGVMRAIGASDRAVMNLVMVEGVLIGLISWVLGSLLAAPISKILSDIIHLAVFDAASEFAYTPTGPLYWLGLVLVLSVFASVLPARNAARLTIREALAYE